MSSPGLLSGDQTQLPPGNPQWGLFLNGASVVLADNVVALEYLKEYTNADYPLEPGPGGTGPISFESYDHVEHPFAVTLQFSKGGSVEERTAFLNSIDSALQSMNLYDVHTPEKFYTSVSGERVGLKRTASNGASLITVDVRFTQIRISTQSSFQNTQQPGGANQINNGVAQGQALTQQQQQVLDGGGDGGFL
jgi:hypothetical protein